MSDAAPVVEVVAAVISRDGRRVLLGSRPAGKPYAGYWEFPGGKVEPGETLEGALARELQEEIGIIVTACSPWITRVHVYEHATVRLHFFRVTDWEGEPAELERQALAWQPLERVEAAPLLPANLPILTALRLPERYAVSNAAEMGPDVFLGALDRALADGLKLVQFREKTLPAGLRAELGREVAARARAAGARVLANGGPELALAIGADGVHLDSRALMAAAARPDFPLVGASCHDRDELEQAARLGVDFAVLSPVLPTRSHPDAGPLGWTRFAELARGLPMPVYALGGMTPAHLAEARRHGAHGVALMRAAWPAV